MLGERALGDNLTDRLTGERRGLRVHTIQNDNPYLGLDPTREGNGKYPVIFEPLQNVQMSRSTYKVPPSLISSHISVTSLTSKGI